MESHNHRTINLLFHAEDRERAWRDAFRRLAPHINVRNWPDWHPDDQADYALVWRPPAGELARHGSLQAIFSIGAGLDHLSSDADLPAGIPVVRMVDPALTAGMSEFVVLNVLYHHRKMTTYMAQQNATNWQGHEYTPAHQTTVGVMGAGVLGMDAIEKLKPFGFALRVWSRTPKLGTGVAHYAGPDDLNDFLGGVDILVCLLPLTAETRGILDRKTFAELPDGAAIINVGRGQHLVEDDLVAALESGKVGAATLDVFNQEPLPPESELWRHPRVAITPHIASMTSPLTAVPMVVDQIRAHQSGGVLRHVANMARGY